MREYINIFGLLIFGSGVTNLVYSIGGITPTIAGSIVSIVIGLIVYFVSGRKGS